MFRSDVHAGPRKGCRWMRCALVVLDNVVAPAVPWIVCDGGTIRGYAVVARLRHTTAAEWLCRRGLGELADHYRLAVPSVA